MNYEVPSYKPDDMPTVAGHSATILLRTKEKEVLFKLRKAVMDKFERPWVYIYEYDGKHEIAVSNNWGGSLDKQTREKVKNFAKEFMNDIDADTEPQPDNEATDAVASVTEVADTERPVN